MQTRMFRVIHATHPQMCQWHQRFVLRWKKMPHFLNTLQSTLDYAKGTVAILFLLFLNVPED